MKEYSIKELEEFTGVKAHTLRIWEQRYSLFNPKRSSTNIRSYTDMDLKKALNVNLLYSNGWKISKIANLAELEMEVEIKKLISDNETPDNLHVDQFLSYIISFEEDNIITKLNSLCDEHGMLEAYTKFYVPLLIRIGDLWLVGGISVAQEHFFSNILREFILYKTKELETNSDENRKKVVLFLHETEVHELGLLMSQYYLKLNGTECFYLGARVPISDLEICVSQIQPDYLLTSFISRIEKSKIATIINEIATFFDLKNLIVSGYQVEFNPEPFLKKVKIASDINCLDDFV